MSSQPLEPLSDTERGNVPRRTLPLRRAETCSKIGCDNPRRASGAYCNKCHAKAMKDWRAKQPKMPKPPKEKISTNGIRIEDVAPDAPPLARHDSQYRAIHERLLATQPGQRFRATLGSDYLANCARASVLSFARRNGVVIGTLLVGNQLEVTREQETGE